MEKNSFAGEEDWEHAIASTRTKDGHLCPTAYPLSLACVQSNTRLIFHAYP
jgi:hypothetical protein